MVKDPMVDLTEYLAIDRIFVVRQTNNKESKYLVGEYQCL